MTMSACTPSSQQVTKPRGLSLQAHQAPLMVASVQTGGLCSSVVLQAVNELGDTDDPMNNWYFGKSGEIFQYQLVGTHPTTSGE
jgi:hypothetical protein